MEARIMAMEDIRRRWTWRAVVLLVLLNTLLWASFALSGGRVRSPLRIPASSSAPASH
jgi:hypothetical protein